MVVLEWICAIAEGKRLPPIVYTIAGFRVGLLKMTSKIVKIDRIHLFSSSMFKTAKFSTLLSVTHVSCQLSCSFGIQFPSSALNIDTFLGVQQC